MNEEEKMIVEELKKEIDSLITKLEKDKPKEDYSIWVLFKNYGIDMDKFNIMSINFEITKYFIKRLKTRKIKYINLDEYSFGGLPWSNSLRFIWD